MARYGDLDELRELIASFTGMFTDEGFMIDYHAVLRAVDNAETVDVVPKIEWISIEERLPEEKVNCLVHYKHVYADNDGYWAIGVSFYDGCEFRIGLAYKVTHWMPLPEPPKE